MEKTRLVREEVDGKEFFPAKVGISAFDVVICECNFHYLHLDLACKQLCLRRRNESTQTQIF